MSAEEKTDKIMLKINAHQKPSTRIPSINLAANKIIRAFITKRKSPNVTTVIGKVSKTKIGLIMALRQANTRANIMAVVIFEICTPDKIFEST